MTSKPSTVIEVSWETVNKVGGINTVISGKADLSAKNYNTYWMVGPLFPERQELDFKELAPPEELRYVFEDLQKFNITCVFGQWLIDGKPETILVDARESTINLDQVKGLLWEQFQVDTLHASGDYNEPLKWAWAVGMLIERVQNNSSEPVVAHLHEWLSGLALLYLKSQKSKAATVFTTHATMLGRTISASTDIDLYGELKHLDADALARQLRVHDKFSTEVACAKYCDIFTTVSEITGMEAEHLLGRKPDVLLFNGIDAAEYPTFEEASIMHANAREKMRDFMDYYFFSHYTFDLDQSLTFFTSGRYEHRNKGYDTLIHSLGKLNTHLKETNHKKTVIVFFFVPGEVHGKKTELMEERASFTHMKQFIEQYQREIVRTILRNASNLDTLSCNDLLSDEARREITKMARGMSHEGDPPLVTHNIPNEVQDPILAGFRANGLLNREEDKVKVIRYPIYLTGSDGLLDLNYWDAVAGSHLGIFPSYYEPWGYTPVEAAALGVPAVTTDLAGFGRFVKEHTDAQNGVFVVDRFHKSFDEVSHNLFTTLASFCDLDKYGRQEEKLAAKRISQFTEWKTFIKEYFRAHKKAYEKQISS